jgi:hypothetical protein
MSICSSLFVTPFSQILKSCNILLQHYATEPLTGIFFILRQVSRWYLSRPELHSRSRTLKRNDYESALADIPLIRDAPLCLLMTGKFFMNLWPRSYRSIKFQIDPTIMAETDKRSSTQRYWKSLNWDDIKFGYEYTEGLPLLTDTAPPISNLLPVFQT